MQRQGGFPAAETPRLAPRRWFPHAPGRPVTAIDPNRSAVVLASSFLGVYAHAGFLNGLGITPARIVGASAGALAGAFFAAGMRGGTLRDAALDRVLRRSFLDAGALFRLPGVLTSLGFSGLFSGKRTVARLREMLGEIDIADLATPLDLAVTNAVTSRTEIRREGPLAEFVMASCAVPVLFAIQKVAGGRYLDGGIVGELPFDHLLDDPALDTLILHRIRHEAGTTPRVRPDTAVSALGVVRRCACGELHDLRVARARAAGKRVIESETLAPFPGLFSHKLAPVCYRRGLETGGRLRNDMDLSQDC